MQSGSRFSEDMKHAPDEKIETPTDSPVASLAGDVDPEKAETQAAAPPAEEFPHGLQLLVILASIYLAVFLQAIDRTIIATALPRITDDFQSFGDIGWYNGAFLLTISAFQLFLGKVYTFYSPKWIFIGLIVIFEIGSALCGAAPDSVAFIWGRAIAGIGASGVMNGGMVLLIYAAPLHKRPLYMGLIGAVFAIASVAGPLLGGVFTTKVSWRWCVYINLPIGALVLIFLIFALKTPPIRQPGLSTKAKLAQLDPLGTIVFIPCIVCLLLALQWGGSTYSWSDGRIIALLVVFSVLLLVFVAIQIWKGDAGTVPPSVIKQRSIAAGVWFSFMVGGAFLGAVYYIPIWFQAIKGDTAIASGLSTLPLMLGLVVASIITGIVISRVGYYTPPMILCSIILPIGTGLLSTFKTTTEHPYWIGVQVLTGAGIGVGMQQANLAAQTVLPKHQQSTGVALMFFAQALGGTVSVSICQNILNNKLIAGLSHISGFNPSDVVNAGATNLRHAFPQQYLPEVLEIYNDSLTDVFYVVTGFAACSILGAVAMEWKSTAAGKKGQEAADEKKKQVERKAGSAAVGAVGADVQA